MALSVIWLPQVGPTSVSDTPVGRDVGHPGQGVGDRLLRGRCAAGADTVRSAWTCTVAEDPWPRISTVAAG